ncbi:MAG: transglycosylase SLT domain-containing protein [Burkholderiales bacterium]|nr:transglycosylase SLT domain-containing protein [Burkholderiales bacterium]
MSATNGSVLSPASGAMARLAAATRSALALIGLVALIVSAYPAAREPLFRQVALAAAPGWDGEGPGVETSPREAADRGAVHERETRALVEFIARRYRVAEEAIAGFVAAAYRAGSELRLDPLLILAVMAVESRFNPVAESVLGAKGLMQVIGRFHLDKLAEHGGEPALLDPEVNIQVGARILRDCLRRVGDLEGALRMYAGAASEEPGAQYAAKVLAERARLQQALRARPAS